MANEVLIRVLERKRKYMWPEAQLNFWLIVMIAAAATIVGVFTYFMQLQSVFHLGVPWCVSTPFPPLPPPPLKTNAVPNTPSLPQDIPLQHSHRLPLPPLPPHNPRPNPTTPTPPRHSRAGLLHPLRPLPDRAYRNVHPALRAHRLRKQLLQPLPAEFGPGERGSDAGVVGDAGDLSGLEGRVCVLYRRDGVFALDDGHGVSSQSGQF